jgi:multiple sugar transport system permease protein
MGAYLILTFFALIMLFPFIFMLTTSLKTPDDTFNYPPRLLPREGVEISLDGYAEPVPLYVIEKDGVQSQFALVESGIPAGIYAEVDNLANTY